MAVSAKIIRALALVGLAWAAAGAAAAKPRAMMLGDSAAAPAGYVDFCRRQPQDCGLATGETPAASTGPDLAPGALIAGRTVAPASAAPRLGPGLWSKLNDVNAQVNRAIAPRTDAAAFGRTDYWQTPIADGRGYGDCEDYVLEKIRALVAAGVPRSALSIALAVTRSGETHAVLLVDTSAGDFVLDNLSAGVARWDAAPYRWLTRQVAGQPLTWARITG